MNESESVVKVSMNGDRSSSMKDVPLSAIVNVVGLSKSKSITHTFVP